MKVKWNLEYTTKSVYAIIVGCAVALFILIMLNISGIFDVFGVLLSILTPFLWAFAIAYILNRPVHFFETKVFSFMSRQKNRHKAVRGLSVAVVLILSLLIVAGLVWILVPQLVESLTSLVDQLPLYFDSFVEWLRSTLESFNIGSDKIMANVPTWESLLNTFLGTLKSAIPDLNTGVNFTVSIIGSVGSAFVALIASIYLMVSKERFIMQLKKFMFGVFPKKFVENTIRITRDSNKIFSGFITGKLFESLIVTGVTFVVMSIFGLHYSLLISVIMGIFNLLPYFGPFIGAIPSVLILLMVQPLDALIFIIITVVLQQIVGQIIGPRIIGNSTGLTAFWVIFAIILGGGLFGLLGMILGIPVFAIIYSVVKEYVEYRLKKKGLSTKAADYSSSAKPKQ